MGWRHFSPGKSIAVVGNGPVSARQGRKIDRFSFVVRFNRFKNYGVSGLKTDAIVVAPTGRPGRLNAENHCDPIDQKPQIWISKPAGIIAGQNREAMLNGEDDGSRRDWTEEIRSNHARDRLVIHFGAEIYHGATARLRALGATNFVEPSTGLLTILYLQKHFSAPIVLFGFTHEGWRGHPWEAERRLIDSLPNCRRSHRYP